MKCTCCGASLGMFKKYAPLSDGAICLKCFKELGFDVNDKDNYTDATCREIKAGYVHYANKQNKAILEKYGLPTFGFAHYGEERDVDATEEEKQVFSILCDMFQSKGYDPEQLDLVRKSDNYVAAAIGDYDLARFKATDRVKWIIFPAAETGAVKHYIESVTEVFTFDKLLNTQIHKMSAYADIKKRASEEAQ